MKPLEEIQDEIVERLHAGEDVDRSAILAAHPEHAPALAAFLDLVGEIEAGTPDSLPPPSRLGDFLILREVGRGGMGVVYEAEQKSLGRRVALKVLPPALGHDRRLLERFRREAQAAGRLRHPGIVPVYSFGEVAGTPFFAMELVGGRSLAQILTARRRGDHAGLPVTPDAWQRFVLDIAARVADALAYAHGRGILHRDVKPANVMIDDDGTPRLTDFGLAQDLWQEGLTMSGEIFGSPKYMSPEQAFQRQVAVDERTDIYSLGVTLYELLTLRLPYPSNTSSEYMVALERGDVVPLRDVDATIDEGLERSVLRALAKEPEERYATAADFARDLRAVLDGRPVATPPPLPASASTPAARALGATATAGAPPPPPPPPAPAPPARPHRHPAHARSHGSFTKALLTVGCLGLIVFAVVIFGGAMLIGVPVSLEAESPPPALNRAPTTSSMPSNRDLHVMAVSDAPGVEATLRSWITPRIVLRDIVARNALGTYRCELDVPVPRGVKGDLQLDVTWAVSVDGGAWRSLAPEAPVESYVLEKAGRLTLTRTADLAALLTDTGSAESVALAHEALVRIRRVGSSPESGTTTRFRIQKKLLVYAAFPDHYPTGIRGGRVELVMQRSLSPTAATLLEVGATERGEKELIVQLDFEHGSGTIATAVRAELFVPGSEAPFATAPLVFEAFDGDGVLRATRRVAFTLNTAPLDEEARLMLELHSGAIDSLRVVLSPSRDLVLAETNLDSYWDGTVDSLVPFALGAR